MRLLYKQKFESGSGKALDVPDNGTIGQVKVLIEQRENIPSNQQRLSWERELDLKDDHTLEDYDIIDGTVLLLVTGMVITVNSENLRTGDKNSTDVIVDKVTAIYEIKDIVSERLFGRRLPWLCQFLYAGPSGVTDPKLPDKSHVVEHRIPNGSHLTLVIYTGSIPVEVDIITSTDKYHNMHGCLYVDSGDTLDDVMVILERVQFYDAISALSHIHVKKADQQLYLVDGVKIPNDRMKVVSDIVNHRTSRGLNIIMVPTFVDLIPRVYFVTLDLQTYSLTRNDGITNKTDVQKLSSMISRKLESAGMGGTVRYVVFLNHTQKGLHHYKSHNQPR